MSKKKVVVIGGGNGSAVMLVALKQNIERFDVAGVVSMSDSGGSTGVLRKKFGILPPGDILRAVLAISSFDYPTLKKIFYEHRFKVKGLSGEHNLGNMLLLSVWQNNGKNFMGAVQALSDSVRSLGKILPTTLSRTDLCVKLSNGRVIKSESAIDCPTYDRKLKITQAWLEPTVRANSEVIQAIKAADYVLLAPGSVYTSVIATLLPSGISEAIKKSRAKLIYVSGNAYRTDGETGSETLVGVLSDLKKYLPQPIDLVIHNSHQLNSAQQEKYRQKKWAVFKDDPRKIKDVKIVSQDYERAEGGLCAIKLGKILKKYLV